MQTESFRQLSVYQSLYRLVSGRLRAALPDSLLPATEQAFLYTVTAIPGQVDLSVVAGYDNDLTFVQTAYWALLGRFPKREEAFRWSGDPPRIPGPPRWSVLEALMSSIEFSARQLHVTNIPPHTRVPPRTRLIRTLRIAYNHLPHGLQHAIHQLYHCGKDILAK